MTGNKYDAFTGFQTRMENLFLFKPIFQLNNRKPVKYKDINFKELGFAILLHILENMLTGTERVTPESLTIFIQKIVKLIYKRNLSSYEAEDLRVLIVDKRLRNSGHKHTYAFTDFETGEKKQFFVDLIVYDEYSLQSMRDKNIYLKLSDQAIELLFKTKEVFQEAQITITILFFKQQLEKKNFTSSLRISMELAFQIRQSISSFEEKILRMKSNILSEYNTKKIEDYLSRSTEQSKKEREQIESLYYEIKEIKRRYQTMRLTKSQQDQLDKIEKIDEYLRECMIYHEKLLEKKQTLLQTIKNSFEQFIENLFNKTFNFEKEIIDSWFKHEITQETLSKLLLPMTPLYHKKIYNPIHSFLPQRFRREYHEEKEKKVYISEEERRKSLKQEEIEREKRDDIRYKILEVILLPIIQYNSYSLIETLNQLKVDDPSLYHKIMIEHIDEFIFTCVQLHRVNYRKFEELDTHKLKASPRIVRLITRLIQNYKSLLEIGEFEIVPDSQMMKVSDKIKITDLIFLRKGDSLDKEKAVKESFKSLQ